MSFVHEASDFPELLRIVAADRGLSPALVEKDYWVTHSLWALHEAGFDVWFKGGTSLSKGFRLIKRFSEDLDLKVEAGKVATLPPVSSWEKESATAKKERRLYFEAFPTALVVPGAVVSLDEASADAKWRGANVLVTYPGLHIADLPGVMSPSVKLEIGSARVTPFVPTDLTSFVHDRLSSQGLLGEFTDNRCKGVRCVHPLVTLLEKLDALHKKCLGDKAPATFVRHFEDAAHIIAAIHELPGMTDYENVRRLAEDMLANGQIKPLPASTAAELLPEANDRWKAIEEAHKAIGPMFWGERISIADACGKIRDWIAKELS